VNAVLREITKLFASLERSVILDLLLAQILEGVVEPVAHLIAHDPADVDAAGLGQGFKPRRDIHAVAKDVVLLGDHVSQIDPNAESDPAFLGHLGLAFAHPALDRYRAANGVHHTGKLCQ
jgi:hypothetical protein